MECKPYELIVSEGKLPIWKAIVAAAFFTGLVYLLYLDFRMFYNAGVNEKTGLLAAKSLKRLGNCLVGGIAFSITKSVLIDTDTDKLISRYCVGPFHRDILTAVPTLEYVSVFKNGKDEFEVNLWYKGNKHYKMYVFESKSPAIGFSRQVAQKLKIDLLDATVKGNSQWLDVGLES